MTATANSGYNFVNWTANGSVVSTSASYTLTLNSSITLVANFTPVVATQYTIAVSASPSADGTVSGGGTFAAGSSDTVTATANSGYNFVNWTANGSVVSTSASYTLTLSGNVTLVANFTPTPQGDPVPSNRRIDWTYTGVPGGIPNRTTICATFSPGATAAAITSAINACNNGVVFLNAGTYTAASLGGTIQVYKSNVTLRGAGADQTILTGHRCYIPWKWRQRITRNGDYRWSDQGLDNIYRSVDCKSFRGNDDRD